MSEGGIVCDASSHFPHPPPCTHTDHEIAVEEEVEVRDEGEVQIVVHVQGRYLGYR